MFQGVMYDGAVSGDTLVTPNSQIGLEIRTVSSGPYGVQNLYALGRILVGDFNEGGFVVGKHGDHPSLRYYYHFKVLLAGEALRFPRGAWLGEPQVQYLIKDIQFSFRPFPVIGEQKYELAAKIIFNSLDERNIFLWADMDPTPASQLSLFESVFRFEGESRYHFDNALAIAAVPA